MSYTQVKVSVDPAIASDFKAACAEANMSIASVLSGYMSAYCQGAGKPGVFPGVATKRQRRAAVKRLVIQLESIKLAEERYRDNIPENLQGSSFYTNADESVVAMEEAAEILASVYMVP